MERLVDTKDPQNPQLRNPSKKLGNPFTSSGRLGDQTSHRQTTRSNNEPQEMKTIMRTLLPFSNCQLGKPFITTIVSFLLLLVGWQVNAQVFTVTDFTWSSANATSVTIDMINPGGDRDGYLIVINTENSFTNYSGQALPTADPAYSGSGEQVVGTVFSFSPNLTITGLSPNTTYYVSISAYKTELGQTNPTVGINRVERVATCGTTPAFPGGIGFTSGSGQITISELVRGDVEEEYTGFLVKINTTNAFSNPLQIESSLPTANTVYGGSGEQVVYVGTSTAPNVTVTNLSTSSTPVEYFFRVWAYTTNCSNGNYIFRQVGSSASDYTCVSTAPADGFNSNLGTGGGSIDIYDLSPIYFRSNTVPDAGVLVYINDVNSFTAPPTTISGLPVANSVYSGSGQQLMTVGAAVSGFAPVSGLTPNTTYYFQSYPYYSCDGLTTYVNPNDFKSHSLTTCNFSDNLASAPIFGSITSTSMALNSFTALSPAAPATAPDGYIIRINDTNNFSTYAHGTALPTGDPAYSGTGEQVLYVGNSTTPNLNITGLSANTTYYFNIVAYYPNCGVPSVRRYQQEGYTFSQSNSGTAAPSITFNDLYKSVGDADFNLSATASDGSTVSFQILSQSDFGTSLSGTNNETVTLGGVGTVLIEASANGATTQATLTITNLAVNGTYFMTENEVFFGENGTRTTQANFNGGTYGTKGSGVEVLDGAVWISSSEGGANNAGVLVRQNLDGTSPLTWDVPSTLANNGGVSAFSADGKIWSFNNGAAGVGEIYSRDSDGSNVQLVHAFTGVGLFSPISDLVELGGVLYGGAFFDAASSAGGIYSLTSDGMGGYTYAVEHTFTATDPERQPVYGLTVFNNLIWYTGLNNRLVAYDPVTKTTPYSYDLGEFAYNPIVANNALYVFDADEIWRVTNGGATIQSIYVFTDYRNRNLVSFDGEYFYGSGRQIFRSEGVIYRIKPDGTGFEELYTNPGAVFTYRPTNILSRATTGVAFADQTVTHGSTTTLASQTNSTGAITYELVGDVTGSTLLGDQFTAGNVGTVTIRTTVAEDGNFNSTTSDATFTIVKADPTFIVNDIIVPFQSALRTLNPVISNYPGTPVYEFVDGAGLVTTGPNTGATISGNTLNFTSSVPGVETIRATLAETSNFNGRTVDFTFDLQKRVVTALQIILNEPASFEYDASPKDYTVGLSASFNPPLPLTDFDLTYEGRNGTVYASSNTAPTDAGDYTITASVNASNATYQGSDATDFTITPVATTIDLNLPAMNPVYTGSGQGISPFANDVSGSPTLTLTTEYSVQSAGAFSTTLPVDAGTYDVRVNLDASETNYTASEATGTFTIDGTPQAITFNPIPDVECGQTTIDLTLYATSSTGSTISFASDNPAVATISGGTATIVGPGTANITASQAGNASIEPAVDQTQTLTIAAVQDNYAVDNPGNVLVCDGGPYLLPPLTEGNYFSGPGGTGTALSAGNPIAVNSTVYVYGVSSTNATCTDENSFTVTIETLAIDQPSDISALGSYTLPALTNGSYFSATGGGGTPLSAGDVINTTQTIYIYNTDAGTGCTREHSFTVTIVPNPALHFEQVTNLTDYDYLSVPDDNSLDFTNSFTYEAWVNFDQLSVTTAGYGWRSFFQKSRFTDSYGLMLFSSSKLLRFYHNGVGGNSTDYTWSSLAPNTWHHVAVKYDGANSKTSILIDGVEVSSNTSQTGSLVVNTEPLLIGSGDVRASDPYPFDGAMDEIRFWNVARTDAEILANKDLELQGNEPGLVLYYNFSEGTIEGDNTGLSQVPDQSTAGNNATFNRFALTGTASNYVDGSGNGVSPGLPQSITFDPLSNVNFGDADFNLTATASSSLAVSYVSSNTAVATVSGSTVTVVGVGTTTITASQSGDAAYLPAAGVNQTLTVDPFTTSISLNLPGTNPTYTGVGQGISPTANDTGGNPTLNLVTEYSPQGAGTFSTTLPINAGTYDVRVNLAASETNYSAPQATGTFIIDKAPLTARLNDASLIYGVIGANNHPATYTGFVNGETESVLNITLGSPTAIYLDLVNSGYYNVGGPYTGGITWESPLTSITSNNYAITFEPGDITSVTPRPINVTANPKSFVYGEDVNTGHTVVFEPYDEPGQRGLANGENAANFAGSALFDNITEVNVGVYASAIIPNGGLTNANYAINFVGGELTITTKGLTVTADNRTITYGDDANAGNTVTYSGFISGENESVLGGTLTFDNINAIGVGAYTGVILPEGLTSSNYNLTFVEADLTIVPKALTVTANNRTITYGDDANIGNAVTYSGFVLSEDEGSLNGSLTFANISQTDVGNYSGAIVPSGLSSSDYAVSFISGDLTIAPRAITVTADAKSKTYGDIDPALSYQVTSGALQGSDMISGALTRVVGENIGTYAINQGTLDAGSNYTLTYVSDDLTIGARPITITADAKSKTYGDTDPVLTYQITTGALQGSDVLTGDLTRVAGEGVGTYAIQQGTVANSNYAITFVPDDLTIGGRAITVTADPASKTYGDSDPTFTYQLTSGSLVGSDAFVGILERAAGENVGTYALNQGTLGINANYTITFVPADLTIGTRAITVTADAQTKVYGDADPTLTYQLTSGSLAGSDAFTGALARDAGELARSNPSDMTDNTYAINQGTLALGSNYDLTFVSNDLTITRRPLEYTWDPQTIVYGDDIASPAFSLVSGSLVAGDDLFVTINATSQDNVRRVFQLNGIGTEEMPIGFISSNGTEIEETASGLNRKFNYAISNQPTTISLTATARPITVTADAQTKVYGDVDPALTYQITSGSLVNTSIGGTDALTGTLARVSGEAVGNYAINQGTLNHPNYDITYVSDDLTIGTRAITVTADAQSKTYGDADPALTYQVTSGTLQGSDMISGALSRVAGEGVGTYAINQGTLDAGSNYALTYVSNDLTIGTRAITVTADPASKIYGDTDPAFTYQITSGSLAGSDVFVGILERAAGENIGTYALNQGTLGINVNYTITFVPADLTIGARALTVTADAQSKVYGDADPALTYQVTTGALQGGDVFTGTLTRVSGENAGTYAINQGTLDAGSNYALTYVGANLTIGSRAITVTADAKSKTYGDADPALTYQVTSGALQGSDALTGALTRVTGENVGTYAINQGTLDAGANYALTYVSDDLTISQRAISVIPVSRSKVYGDADPTLDYSLFPGSQLVGSDSFTGSLVRTSGENVGTYDVTLGTLSAGPNYNVSLFSTGTFEITTKPLSVTADDQTKVIGAADPALTYTITSGTLAGSDMLSGALTRVAGETVGDYAIQQGTLDAGSNYALSFTGGTLTITDKIPQTITFGALGAVQYGNADFNLSATGGASGNPVTFVSSDLSVATVSGNTVTIVGAGTTTITASQAGDATYADAADVIQTLMVNPRPIFLAANTGQGKVYGSTDPTLTYQVVAPLPLLSGDVLTGSPERVAGEAVGTYSISRGTLGNPNYNIVSFNPADFEITQRDVTVAVEGSQTKVYGQPDPVLTYQTIPALESGDVFTGALSRAAGENVGTYAIQQGSLNNANYNITFMGDNFSVTTRAVTVTVDAGQTKVYGQADPANFTFTSAPALVTGDAFTGALTRVAGETVGAYAIEQGTLDAGSNYALIYVSDDFSINQKSLTVTVDAGQRKTYGDADPTFTFSLSGTLESGDSFTGAFERVTGEDAGTYLINQGTFTAGSNYFITYIGSSFTIDPIALTITADDQTKVIGAPDPTLTYTITNGALQFSDVVTGALTRDVGETVGTYAITQGTAALSANYNLTFVPGTLTITDKIPQTITFGALSAVIYGDANFDLTATGGASGNAVTLVSSDVSVATVAGSTVTIVGAGTTTITASQAGDATYADAADVNQVLTVNTLPITVTADAGQSKVYGDADPTFTYQIATGNLISGDALTGALDRVAGVDVGTYAINQGTLANANYNITFVGNDFEITKRAVTVTADASQAKVYGDPDPVLTYQASPALVSGDVFTGTLSRLAGENVGTYAISQGTLSNTNYDITFVGDDFTINQLGIIITSEIKTKVYGDPDPIFTVGFISGSLQGSDVLTGALVREAGEDVGTYVINQGTLDNPNYNISFLAENLSITARPITVTADAQSKTYGDTDPTLTYQLTSGVLQGSDALSGDLTRVTGENAGTYTINQGTVSAGSNYALTYVSADLTIDPIALSIVADDKTKVQGTANPAFTYRVTSGTLINGDMLSGVLTVPASAIAVGMYPIQQGTLTAGGNYTISYTDGTFTITDKLLQNITFNALTAVTYGDALFNLSATGGASGNAVTFAGDNTAVATVTSAGEVTIVGAGTVNITANQAGDATYADADPVIQSLTVNQAMLFATPDDKTSTYGDAALPTFTVSYSGFVNGEDESVLTTPVDLSSSAMVGSNAMSYPITASGGAADNYQIVPLIGALAIEPAPLTITADDKASTYGDAIPALSLSYAGFVNSEDETVLTTAPTVATTALSTSDAGNYAITVSGAVASNYTITEVNGTLTIGKANLNVTADDNSKTYGAANPSFSLSYSGFIGADDESVLDTSPVGSSSADATSSVGTYAITASGGVDNNYTFTYTDGTLTVNQATLSVTADDQSKIYGDANPGLTLTYSGFQNGDDETSLTTTPTATTNATSTSSVGTYAITTSGGVADNYTFTYADGTLTVNQATLSVTADDQSKTYGEANPTLTVSYSGFQNGDDATSLTTEPTASTTADETSVVGTYAITASGGVSDNYTFAYTDGTLTVNQATLSVTADDQSKTYGDANPNLTVSYSGFLNGDDETSLTTTPTAATSADATSVVGTYAITSSGGVADNYTFTYTDGTLTVNQATLSVTPDDQSKTYGDANPTLTVSYSGFQNGDDATSLTTEPTASTTADATSVVGTYAINASGGVDDNYTFNYTDGTFTVNQATLNVTADDQSKTYGSANPALTVTYSGFQNGDDETSLTTTPTAATSADETSAVGTYAITTSGGVADNYTFTYTDGTLTVNQATLSVTADDQTITYGEAIPALTFTYAGFQNAEDESVLDTAPTASTTATTTSDAGAYSITVSGGTDNNYTFNYNDGTLTINKADQTITFEALTDKAVGDADFDLTATATSGLTITYTSSDETVATISGSTVTILAAGTTTITASQEGDTNFNSAQDVPQTLTVNANIQDQTITFESLANQTYGASPIELAATASSGLMVTYTSSDAAVATVSGNTVTIHGIGTTTITASQTGNDGFNAAQDVTQTLTIDPATLTVTADDQTKVYGEANPTLTLTYVGFVNGEDATVLDTTPTISTIADASSAVGTYEIAVAGGSASNYVITPVAGTMTITKATLVATADDQVMRTGDAVPALTISYNGFVNGDSEADIDIVPAISTTATSASASGLYDILLSGGEDNNYDLTLINGTLTIETVLGLVLEQSQIMIYPNPVVDKLYIDFPQSLSGEVIKVQLFDLEGRKLQSKEVQGYGIELDVRELPEGILILQMSANGEVIRKRVKKD